MKQYFDWSAVHEKYLSKLKCLAREYGVSLSCGYERWNFQTGSLFWKETVVYFDSWEHPEEITVVDNRYTNLAKEAEEILKQRLKAVGWKKEAKH